VLETPDDAFAGHSQERPAADRTDAFFQSSVEALTEAGDEADSWQESWDAAPPQAAPSSGDWWETFDSPEVRTGCVQTSRCCPHPLEVSSGVLKRREISNS
jgi:hypothetical protein